MTNGKKNWKSSASNKQFRKNSTHCCIWKLCKSAWLASLCSWPLTFWFSSFQIPFFEILKCQWKWALHQLRLIWLLISINQYGYTSLFFVFFFLDHWCLQSLDIVVPPYSLINMSIAVCLPHTKCLSVFEIHTVVMTHSCICHSALSVSKYFLEGIFMSKLLSQDHIYATRINSWLSCELG